MSGSDSARNGPPEQSSYVKDMKVAALKYNSDENSAPIVVAAGSGYVAQKIVEIADECGITVYHDDSAATLLASLKMGQEIPPELYQMVVDVYVAVMKAAENTKPRL
ncbi:MAG: EscU/YscU/HrcU family type III secretion system export apparatus switch protein [Oscillospiraceae bacterium]|jgi:flagellar biosynthesis protein|nr:EscU/YscU/HrcU family type III secretion system export apparatus switch protein [Oscillospiraceae bacterium]